MPSQPQGSRDRRVTPEAVAVATPVTPTARLLALPAARTARAGSAEPQDLHKLELYQVKNDVAQTLHETVMQTLVATTYLAESPATSRLDLVEHLRQATRELRRVIDIFATPDEGC
jgi:hypothetical protein